MKTGLLTSLIILIITQVTWSQTAPVTSTGRVTNAVPGDPAIPVAITVKNFTDIAQFTLSMKFDTTRVRYVSAVTNPSLPGMNVSYVHPAGNTQGKLVFTWSSASNISLTEGTPIADLVFNYISGTGNLTWAYTFGSVCQYKRWSGSSLITLTDSPKYNFYQNGGISYREAPVVTAPVIKNPVPGELSLDLTASGFTNISAFNLNLEYDPLIITYNNLFEKNTVFDTHFVVGDNPGAGGKRQIVIQWYGSAVNLTEGDTLCTLKFSYPEESCNGSLLSWYDTGPNCQYSDYNGDALLDMPKSTFYIDGLVYASLPATWTGAVSNAWGDPANWTSCGTPDVTRHVLIPNVSPNSFPVLTGEKRCRSLEILPGATLIIAPGGNIVIGN